jgi:hypothetical protein
MANGKLGANALTAATNTTVYTVPVDHFSVVSVNFTNRNSQATNSTDCNAVVYGIETSTA